MKSVLRERKSVYWEMKISTFLKSLCEELLQTINSSAVMTVTQYM